MSRRRITVLPLKGIDARASFGTPQETLSMALNVRASDQSLAAKSNHNDYVVSPSGGTQTARNVVQFFMSPPGGPDQNKLVMLTNTTAWLLATQPGTWSSLETGYAMPSMPTPPGGITYPRFAVVNSAHQLVWTCARAGVRVRIYNGTTVTPIAQDYAGDHMIAINHRVMIGNTVEAGVRNGARLRWCANRNFTDWTSQSASFLEVGSNYSSGAVKAMVNFDEIALVSLENELIQIIPTGSLFPAFEEGTHFLGVSIFADESWASFNHVAYFLAPDTVYAWDSRTFVPIGRPIEKLLKPYMNPRRAFGMQGLVVPSRGEYHLLVTEGTRAGDLNAVIFIYDITADRWFMDTPSSVSCISKVNTVYQDTAFVYGTFSAPQEFTLRTDGFDRIGFEELTSHAELGSVNTQDFFALDNQQQPSINAKNEFIGLYFQTTPNAVIIVGHSTDSGDNWTIVPITANAEGFCTYSARVAFSKIRFTFRAIGNYFLLTGPIQMEYDDAGDTY